MAKITSLAELTDVASDDLLVVVDKSDTSMADSGTDKKVQKVNLLKGLVPENGWIPAGETWSYAGADDPTYTMYVSGNATTYLWAGMRFKCTQTTDRMFIITAVGNYDSGNNRTPITLYGGTDFDLANATISNPYYSPVKCPYGFPMNPEKWKLSYINCQEKVTSSVTVGNWYNTGGHSLTIPIGCWNVCYEVSLGSHGMVGTWNQIHSTLSTANNSESNNAYTGGIRHSGNADVYEHITKNFVLTLTSKTTYYLNIRAYESSSASNLLTEGMNGPTIITATCAYL